MAVKTVITTTCDYCRVSKYREIVPGPRDAGAGAGWGKVFKGLATLQANQGRGYDVCPICRNKGLGVLPPANSLKRARVK